MAYPTCWHFRPSSATTLAGGPPVILINDVRQLTGHLAKRRQAAAVIVGEKLEVEQGAATTEESSNGLCGGVSGSVYASLGMGWGGVGEGDPCVREPVCPVDLKVRER